MRWIHVEERLPKQGETVLVWKGDGSPGYDLASVGEGGAWQKEGQTEGAAPTYWMPLPGPPGTTVEDDQGRNIVGEITDGRLVLDIAVEKEAVASLMQHFIDGTAALINGESYFVLDIKNEMADNKVSSVFYLKKALE